MLSKKVPEIVEAFEVLKVVSSNEETRRDAEIRIKAMSDKASSLAGAKEEGLRQGKLEIILNMLKNQLDEETISRLSGLSLEEIREIRENANN